MSEVTALREMEREGLQKKLKSERRWLMLWAIMLVVEMATVIIKLSGGNTPTGMWDVIGNLWLYIGALPIVTGLVVSSMTKYLETLSDLQVYRIRNYK